MLVRLQDQYTITPVREVAGEVAIRSLRIALRRPYRARARACRVGLYSAAPVTEACKPPNRFCGEREAAIDRPSEERENVYGQSLLQLPCPGIDIPFTVHMERTGA